jgi:hypothetical protein
MTSNESGMETRIAKLVTYVFHPLLLPLYALGLIFQFNIFHIYIIPDNVRWLIIGMMSIATIAFPFLMMLLFHRRGLIRSYSLLEREERLYPFAMMALIYYIMYLLFTNIHLSSIICNFLLGISLIVVLALIINFWWKISMHMMGIGGLTGVFIGIAYKYMIDLQILISVTVLLAGIIGFARLKLNSHKPPEIYSGFLMGVAVMLLLYVLL